MGKRSMDLCCKNTRAVRRGVRKMALISISVVLGLVVGALELIAHGGPPSLSLTQSAIDVESKMVALERQRDIFLSSITDTHLMALCGPSSDGTVLPELGRAGTWRGSRPRREQGVTLVTQLSLNRLSMLHRQCDAWTDVIAAALYVPVAAGLIVAPEDAEMHGRPVEAAVQRVAAFHAELEQAGPCILDLELMVESFQNETQTGLYPFNAIRNRALMLAQTEMVLLLDVDFVPSLSFQEDLGSKGGYTRLKRLLAQRRVLILPAFETKTGNITTGEELAVSLARAGKTAAVEAFKAKKIGGFQMSKFRKGHGVTDFDRWVRESLVYPVMYDKGCEPYIVALRQDVPWYDERFRGYGRDKIVHLLHVSVTGVSWVVHPNAFVVHVPHEKAATYKVTKKTKQWDHLLNLYQKVQAEIMTRQWVPNTAFSEQCKAVRDTQDPEHVLAPI